MCKAFERTKNIFRCTVWAGFFPEAKSRTRIQSFERQSLVKDGNQIKSSGFRDNYIPTKGVEGKRWGRFPLFLGSCVPILGKR